ncbi:MAG TPA: serine hydrolase domain-containing protein [Longimicrobiales bacterium]|nr:serine hydrolase domain-containing protein [Longimicrobiales bacterium]
MGKVRVGPVLALLLLVAPAAAQQDDRLTVGSTVERTLAVGDAHRFTITLDSGRFVAGQAVQDGIDLQVVVVGPRGDTLSTFDSPNGAQGPEPFQFNTAASGDFSIIIEPFATATGSGQYALTVALVEPVAATPAGRIDQLMRRVRADEPGVLAVVVRDGKVVYEKAWGLANLTHRIPFTLETKTNIGSTSKQFTAFAILLLAAQNRLSLDDDVRQHIPELPDLGKTVTIRHLLTHTSGYREFLNALAMTGRRIDMGDYIDRDEIIELVKRQPELQNEPGAEFNYNNTAFAFAATIVERVGGQPFPEWMREHVFEPLGMTESLVRTGVGEVIPNSAQGYVPAAGGWREAQDIGASMGAGGIYTTVGDLVRWMRNFRTATLGGRDFFDRMTTRNLLTSGDTSEYGLGLFVDRWRGLRRVHHGGADIAHRSAFVYYPEIDAGVIVQSNNAAFNVGQYADQFAELFLTDELEKVDSPAAVAAAPFDPARFDTVRFDRFAGRYEMTAMKGFILSFTRRDGRFFTQATGQPEIEMTPTSDSTFTIARVNAAITFHQEPDGTVNRITLNQNGVHGAVRVVDEAGAATKPVLAQYVGRYYSAEIETFYEISLAGDSLMLRNRRTLPTHLKHQTGETFTGGQPIATVTFERDDTGKVVAFRAGSGRTRDVVFKKED